MMKKKLLILTSLLLAIFIFLPGLSNTFAQEGQDVEMKAKEGAASKGSAKDSNINEDKKPNSKSAKEEPPPKKRWKIQRFRVRSATR